MKNKYCLFIIEAIREIFTFPKNPRNLRILAVMLAVYQLIIANVGLFIAILGLFHSIQMKDMLLEDIEMQSDLGSYYDFKPYKNQIHLLSASSLARITETFLFISTGTASLYALVSLLLVFGVLKNKSYLILPWLIFYFIGIIASFAVMYLAAIDKIMRLFHGPFYYCCFCLAVIFCDSFVWIAIHSFYSYLLTAKDPKKSIKILSSTPSKKRSRRLRKENMHIGTNGYKHTIYSPDVEYQKV